MRCLLSLAQWVAGAVEANSLHVLRHLGITHLLNATEDLLMPDPGANFRRAVYLCLHALPTTRLARLLPRSREACAVAKAS